MRRLGLTALLVLGAACGGGSPARPSGGGTIAPQTFTFTGSARALAAGSCTGDGHDFDAPEGQISITLAQTTPAEAMTVQICPSGNTYSQDECTLTRRRIDIGQTLTAARRGQASRPQAQNLSMLPLTCGTNAPPSPAPIAYTVTVRTGV